MREHITLLMNLAALNDSALAKHIRHRLVKRLPAVQDVQPRFRRGRPLSIMSASSVFATSLFSEPPSIRPRMRFLGLPVPDKLKEILTQLYGRDDDDDISDTGASDKAGNPNETNDAGDGE